MVIMKLFVLTFLGIVSYSTSFRHATRAISPTRLRLSNEKLVSSELPPVSVPKPLLAQSNELDIIPEQTNYKSDIIKTSGLVAAALAFATGLSAFKGSAAGVEFVSGYLLELCLSVDNLIVFILLFDSFKVNKKDQEIVLKYGILGALILRGIFISAGALAVESFKQVLGLFAAILLYSSYKVLFQGEEDEDEDIADNAIVKFAKKYLNTTDKYDGQKFFTEVDGKMLATPLFLCLVCVELSDILFAFDSVPAIFGITTDPFIVFTSNIFAISGLRALFGVLSSAVDSLKYLDKAVGVILGIIAVKLGAEVFNIELLTPLQSLVVVLSLLGVGVGASLIFKDKEEDSAIEEKK